MTFNQFNDYEPPVSGGTIPIKLPGSYPGKVPQPRGHNPSPLPPPTDYYVTRKEVRDLLAKYPIETLMKLVENATDGNLVTLGVDGQVIDSQVNISVLKAIVGDDSGKSARAIAAEEVATIVDGAPEALDTLKEASDIINRLIEQGQALQTELGTKASKDELSNAVTTVNKSLANKAENSVVIPAITAVNASLATKANADKVWLRGDDVTGETNFAQSIKVNEITSLDEIEGMADGIKFDAPIVSNTVSYGGENEPAFAVIEGNMIQAFSNDGSSNSDLVFRGRSFYFQGNSYDYPQSPPAIYTEGDIFCDGAIVTSEITDENDYIQNLTIENNEISAHFTDNEWGGQWGEIVLNGNVFVKNGALDCYGAPLTTSSISTEWLTIHNYEEYSSIDLTYSDVAPLKSGVLSACSVENIDYGEGHAGINFLINTYSSDPWSGEQYPSTYSFDCYGDLHVPNAIYTNYLYIDGHIAQNGYYGEDNSGYVQNNIQPAYVGMNANSSSEFEYANYDVSMTPEGFNLFYSGQYYDGNDWMNRSSSVNLSRDGLFIDGGSDAYDTQDAISLTIDSGLFLNSSDGSSTSLGPSGISHYTCDEDGNRIGADLNSHDFATLREMIDNFRAPQGA